MDIDQRSFRNAMGCFPTGVTVVTALTPGGAPVGVTVSSFTSLSLDPPLVLFCLDRRTQSLDAFEKGTFFAIHVLAEDQRDVSMRFSSRSPDKWSGVSWKPSPEGVPLLDGCLTRLECRREVVHEGGDHLILVGRVIRLDYAQGGRPLVYFRGAYARLD